MEGGGDRTPVAATFIGRMSGKRRTALASIAAATALVLLKLVTGVITGSLGLISAGIESSGDLIAAVLTFVAIRLAGKPADERHQYGHARAENLTALAEAAILVGGGVFVVHEAYDRLRSGGGHELVASWYVFAVIGAAIVVDISRTLTSLRTARHYNSAALRSNAFHFGADLIGTVAVLVGMLLVHGGYDQADAYVALSISLLIFAAAARLIFENARSLMDMAPAAAYAAAEAAVATITPPVELRRLRVREVAGTHFADLVVAIPAAAALAEGHAAADRVEAALRGALPGSDVVVHIEPSDRDQTLTDRVLTAALSVPGVREAHNVTVFQRNGATDVSLHLKLPPGMALGDGHAVTEEVARAIRAVAPQVTSVQSHLEPVDAEVGAQPLEPADDSRLRESVNELVEQIGGAAIRDIRFVGSDRGPVGFVTLALPPSTTVHEAHRRASEIEQAAHERLPELRELVIHTEP